MSLIVSSNFWKEGVAANNFGTSASRLQSQLLGFKEID